jgi:hypothetical protein
MKLNGRGFAPNAFISAALAAVLLASCSTPPPPAPPPPPPPPPIALSSSLIQDAAAYQVYMAKTAAIPTDFKSGDEVAQDLKAGDSYDPQQLLRGSITYGAIMALQDPTFVTEVRVFAVNPDSRIKIRDAIISNPNYVVAIKGSDTAAGLVIAALMAQGQKLAADGVATKQAAYSIQHQAWSKEIVTNRDQRLADAKSVSGLALQSTVDDANRLQQAAVGATPLVMTAPPAVSPYPPTVVRSLALAALAVLGWAGDDQSAITGPLVADPSDAACLGMAKLNLYQCLAVSKPHYEDVFCLGQHVMSDTAQCIEIAAGAPPPVYVPLAVSKTEVAYGAKPAAKHRAKKKK